MCLSQTQLRHLRTDQHTGWGLKGFCYALYRPCTNPDLINRLRSWAFSRHWADISPLQPISPSGPWLCGQPTHLASITKPTRVEDTFVCWKKVIGSTVNFSNVDYAQRCSGKVLSASEKVFKTDIQTSSLKQSVTCACLCYWIDAQLATSEHGSNAEGRA